MTLIFDVARFAAQSSRLWRTRTLLHGSLARNRNVLEFEVPRQRTPPCATKALHNPGPRNLAPPPKHERPTDTGGPFQLLQRRRPKEHTPPKFFDIAKTYISSSSLSGSGPAIISSATLSVRARIASSRRSDISRCSVR